jgi:hypothetical protein
VQAAAQNARQTETARLRLAQTLLLGADLAMRQKDPSRALSLLQAYDQSVTGLSNAADLTLEGNKIRVQALLDTGQVDQATEQVQKLAAANSTAAAPFVQSVLNRLSERSEAARRENNHEETAKLSAARASLTGYLVEWANNNKDPKIQQELPTYKMHHANTIREAAALQEPGEKKTAMLKDATARYDEVKRSPGVSLQTALNADFGIGVIQYELGNFDEASKSLGALVQSRKLGSPLVQESDAGVTRFRDNEFYWEAMGKWLRSNINIAKRDPGDTRSQQMLAAAKQTLRGLYVTNGARTGGTRWRELFEEMRNDPDVLAGWTPGTAVQEASPTTGPSTAPAAPVAPVAAGTVGR